MSLVQSFTHLKDRPDADQAFALLQRIASLVKPIMRKHGWNLPVLAEFFPENPALVGLNVNGGQKICLRLRPPHSPSTFYDEEQIILVMLHELTHNVHGPHNQDFYKYLSGLEAEWDELKRTGYSGEGFHSTGKRLGVGISHNLPPHQARSKALEAAERRKKQSQLMGPSGRLGGRVINKSMRELAAEAAERRAKDDKACGSGIEAQLEAERAANQSVEHTANDIGIEEDDEIQIIEPPQPRNLPPPPGRRGITPSKATKPELRKAPDNRPRPSSVSHSSGVTSAASRQWNCPTCTLINDHLVLQCLACNTLKPSSNPVGWSCQTCGEEGMDHNFWTCRYCGAIKLDSSTSVAVV